MTMTNLFRLRNIRRRCLPAMCLLLAVVICPTRVQGQSDDVADQAPNSPAPPEQFPVFPWDVIKPTNAAYQEAKACGFSPGGFCPCRRPRYRSRRRAEMFRVRPVHQHPRHGRRRQFGPFRRPDQRGRQRPRRPNRQAPGRIRVSHHRRALGRGPPRPSPAGPKHFPRRRAPI